MSAIQKRLDKMEIAFDQEEFVVVDMGTGYIKAGFSGEDVPRCVIPTCVAEQIVEVDPANQQQVDAGFDTKQKKNYAFGDDAILARKTHEYFEPIKRGVVEDIEQMEKLLDYIFTN